MATTATDSDSADGRYEFDDTLTFTNTSSNQISLDQVLDDFDSGLEFFQAVDAEFNSTPIAETPVVNSDGNLVFQGPFDIPGNSSRTLTYTMEETAVCSGQATYSTFACLFEWGTDSTLSTKNTVTVTGVVWWGLGLTLISVALAALIMRLRRSA